MPFPNEHACRLRQPSDFQDGSFRRTTRKTDGKTYHIIMGKLKDDDAMTEQAYRYPKDEWEADTAETHCKAHDGILFEPASSGKSADDLQASEIEAGELDLDGLEELEEPVGDGKSFTLHKKATGVKIGEVKETDNGPVGTFRATFSTFNVVDRDRDITEPGAISSGQQVKICQWGHGWGNIPIGKGVVGTDGQRAWVDGELFLDIPIAKDHYVALKNLGELTEWSYGFEVLEYSISEVEGRQVRVLKKLNVFEVSPVMVGAGINTRTDSIKSGMKFSEHSETIVSELEGYLARVKSLSELRAKDGRVLSAANLNTLDEILGQLDQMSTRLRALREAANPPKDENDGKEVSDGDLRAKFLKERIRHERLVSNIRGMGLVLNAQAG